MRDEGERRCGDVWGAQDRGRGWSCMFVGWGWVVAAGEVVLGVEAVEARG